MQRKICTPGRALRFLADCLHWDKPFAKNVLMIALPMVIQQLVAASLHIVDGLMVSALGDAAYSGVTQANRFTFMFNLFCFGTATGGSIFLSQYWGARDVRRMRQAMGVTLGCSLVVAFLFFCTGLLFPRQIVGLFLQPGESFEQAVRYLSIVVFGYLFTAVDNVFAITIKAGEKTWLPMLSGFVSIGVNTFFNWVFIFGHFGVPAMGAQGAAIATVLSAAVSMLMNMSFAYGLRLPAGAKPREWLCREKGFFGRFMKTVLPVIINEGLWGIGVTIYSVYYGRMGDVAVATMGVCATINDLVWVAVFALSNATAIIIGKTLGAGDRDQAYLYGKRLLAGAVCIGILLGVLVIFIRKPLVGVFGGLSDQVRQQAQTILMIGGATIWFRAFNTINIVGILRSGGDTLFSMVLDVGTLWLVGVPLTGLAALVFHWPLNYVYLCTFVEEAIKVAIGIPHFQSRKWMNVLTEEQS